MQPKLVELHFEELENPYIVVQYIQKIGLKFAAQVVLAAG